MKGPHTIRELNSGMFKVHCRKTINNYHIASKCVNSDGTFLLKAIRISFLMQKIIIIIKKDATGRVEITIIIISTTHNYCNNLPWTRLPSFFFVVTVLIIMTKGLRDNYLLNTMTSKQKI